MDRKEMIISGKTALGIEFGSTRIKAVLIGEDHSPIASGSYEWENQYENNIWTYSLDMRSSTESHWKRWEASASAP